MKYKAGIVFTFLLFFARALMAQQATDHFTIEGEIAKSIEIGPAQLKNYPVVSLDSMTVYSHDMKVRSVMKNIKGVLLKDILSSVDMMAKNPKELSAYYIACIGSDGYKVLFSWNEIFNSEPGNHILIVTEKNGSEEMKQNDRTALITATDRATGRRYVKWLSRIVIQSVK
jgi:hypothetical protein